MWQKDENSQVVRVGPVISPRHIARMLASELGRRAQGFGARRRAKLMANPDGGGYEQRGIVQGNAAALLQGEGCSGGVRNAGNPGSAGQ